MNVLDACPGPPDWSLDWDGIRARFPFVDNLHECPQDPVFHSEGDVGIHTQMVCKVLAANQTFRALPQRDRRIVFGGALLHDVAKPECTRTEPDGRISARGHSSRGEIMARNILWRQCVPFVEREATCALIRHHQVPFYLVDREAPDRVAFAISQAVRCDLLTLVAWADAAGRECRDQQRILDNVDLFAAFCEDRNCLRAPRQFASGFARFEYFRRSDRDPDYAAYDDTKFEVIVMSGVPGAGKDHWIREHAQDLPVISLDEIRRELRIDPGGGQGRVVDAARERSLQLLRKKQPFVWNATNLGRALRDPIIARCADYGARVRLVYVERPELAAREANRTRTDPVPDKAIQRMLDRWEVPRQHEAHRVDHRVD